ncbi:MAG TPA: CoA-binding protein [Deinococcales bacterium]|nr:CoA-binding protein [Deinococcales bacterium]
MADSVARELTSTAEVRGVLEAARTVAVVGFSADEGKPAHYVPAYLEEQGYRVLAVSPALASRGALAFGRPVVATLAELGEPVDVVDVFRRSDKVGDHLEDILAMRPAPKVVWLQLGIRNDEVAARLVERGVSVVQDRCMLADHRRFGLGSRVG